MMILNHGVLSVDNKICQEELCMFQLCGVSLNIRLSAGGKLE